jgi:hypothetical protein
MIQMDLNLDYNTEFKKTTFTIGDQVVNGFKDSLGYCYMDNTQLAKLIGKEEYSARQYWQSKSFKTSVQENPMTGEKDFPLKIRIGSSYHSLVPINWAVSYIRHWDLKDNKNAQVLIDKLIDESLNNRIDYAFGDFD